ncbi:hypothetical protein JCGZ_21336 [Jatropha curcas]|uniref:VLIG-type G domain-containing protein n=1 Tax=Jatropha curcas TaxID=180498 RepID=A0A067JLH7_JATCU|nr:probable disease resistance protein At5g45440 [Jatropha curcas]KDP20865.1 hypothetical protein JCGZ_21336 [Jatropha curcas]
MAQEIENYLLDKLSKGIESSKAPLGKEFKDLKELLREKLSSCSSSDIPAIREKLYTLNDLFSESHALSGKHTLFSTSFNRIKQNLSKIKTEIENIKPSINGQNGNATPTDNNDLQSGSSSSASQLPTKVYGFDEEIMYLLKSLVNPVGINFFKTVGILGLGGAGKTTVCQLLLTRPEVKNHFVPRIWVHMSKKAKEDNNNDPKKSVVLRMLDSLGVEEEMVKSISDEHGLAGLICALHVELMRKRYLIVLDDVQDSDDWYSNLNASLPRNVQWGERLAYGLPKGYGGTIIVTSRSEEVMKIMVGEENIHRLLPLADKDLCWDIFRDEIEQEVKPFRPPHEEELKREVVNKCGGIPLAAKMMGQIMREQIREGSVPTQSIQTQQSSDSILIGQ